jgi:hypothetical protein
LPPDTYEKYCDARAKERKLKWVRLTPHHPLYFVDFPDLRKVIDKNDNWKDVFSSIFASKDVFMGQLTSIEPPRIVVAHNRTSTPSDLRLTASVLEAIMNALGKEYLHELRERCTSAPDIAQQLLSLEEDLSLANRMITALQAVTEESSLGAARHEWWFDEDYLGNSISAVHRFFDLVKEYQSLPRLRGTGHKIETWVKERDTTNAYREAAAQIGILRSELGKS